MSEDSPGQRPPGTKRRPREVHIAFLSFLVEHPAAISADFAFLAPPSRKNTRLEAQSFANSILPLLEKRGLVMHATTLRLQGRKPSHSWWITKDGIRYLSEQTAAIAAAKSLRAEKGRRKADMARAVEELASKCRSGMARAERLPIIIALSTAGCGNAQIGRLLGISGEMVRVDLISAESAAESREVPSYRDPRPHIRLASKLYRDIEQGRLKAGEPMPTLGTMHIETGISYSLVQRAYWLLEAKGLIMLTQRSGFRYYVTGPADRR